MKSLLLIISPPSLLSGFNGVSTQLGFIAALSDGEKKQF